MRIRKNIDEKNPDVIKIAAISDALSHPVRIAILKYVKEKNKVRNDVCNSDLVSNFSYSQATISQHVKKLVSIGIFNIKKEDKYSIYSINKSVLNEYTKLLKDL